jgi:Na+/phosphate symporter
MLKEILRLFKKSDFFMEAREEACRMIRWDREMFENASAILRRNPVPHPNIDVFKKERSVDEAIREIRKKILVHLSISEAVDAPASIVLLDIALDLERIGDYTTNIAEIVDHAKNKLDAGVLDKDLREIEQHTSRYFQVIGIAFERYDKDLIQGIINKEIPHKCDTLLYRLMSEDLGMTQQNAVVLALYTRYLKRIVSHLLNIAKTLVQPFDRARFFPADIPNNQNAHSKDQTKQS